MVTNRQQINDFLSKTYVAVISTVDDEGRPRSTPIWFAWENGAAYMFTSRSSFKWRNLIKRPHAALCVDKREPPYAGVTMDGPVEEVDRPKYDLILSMAVRYYGEAKGTAFAKGYRDDPEGRSVVFRLRPRQISSFGLG